MGPAFQFGSERRIDGKFKFPLPILEFLQAGRGMSGRESAEQEQCGNKLGAHDIGWLLGGEG